MPDLILRLSGDNEDDPSIATGDLSEEDALRVLRTAEITTSKLIPWGSNYTFAVALEIDNCPDRLAIYKPRAGEAPLWDFPDGTLFRREYAAYLLSRRIGWNLVPPTVIRSGPHGVGSVQLYVEPRVPTDEEERDDFWGGTSIDLERMVLFDHITNNADRKIGHCLRDRHGKVWGIDHGLTFNHAPKLRTVLWQFTGLPISPELRDDLQRLQSIRIDVDRDLNRLIDPAERAALWDRVETLLASETYPVLNPRRNVPYGWW